MLLTVAMQSLPARVERPPGCWVSSCSISITPCTRGETLNLCENAQTFINHSLHAWRDPNARCKIRSAVQSLPARVERPLFRKDTVGFSKYFYVKEWGRGPLRLDLHFRCHVSLLNPVPGLSHYCGPTTQAVRSITATVHHGRCYITTGLREWQISQRANSPFFRILPFPRNRHHPLLPVPPHGYGSPKFGRFPQVDEGHGGANVVDVAVFVGVGYIAHSALHSGTLSQYGGVQAAS